MISLKDSLSFTQDLSVAALNYTTTFSQAFKLGIITFHASTNLTETITITLDSFKGAIYDTVLRVKDLNGESDHTYVPDEYTLLHPGDKLKIECTNANNTGVISGEVKALEIG